MDEKTIVIPERIGKVYEVEEVICLAVLVSNGVLPHNSSAGDATYYYTNTTNEDCTKCKFFDNCLACIINE